MILDDLDWQGKVYSNGWDASRGGVIESTEPATGDVLATVRLAEQPGRVHPVAVGPRPPPGPRLPVLSATG
jgi:hypothetical protein